MNESDQAKAILESTLRRQEMHWSSLASDIRLSNGVAADIGIDALKTAILINAGAIVALLAFAGQLWNKDEGRNVAWQVLSSGKPFVLGLVCAAVAFAVAYFYQSFVTVVFQHALAKVSDGGDKLKPNSSFTCAAKITAVLMIGLAFGAVGCFIDGSFAVVDTVQVMSVKAEQKTESVTTPSDSQPLKTKNHAVKPAK